MLIPCSIECAMAHINQRCCLGIGKPPYLLWTSQYIPQNASKSPSIEAALTFALYCKVGSKSKVVSWYSLYALLSSHIRSLAHDPLELPLFR